MSIDPRLLLLRSRAVGVLADIEKAAKIGGKFNSALHPRYPAGNPKGGQFRPKLGTGAGGQEIFMPVYTGSNKIIQSFEAATLAVANQMAQGILTGAQKLMGMKTHPDDANNTKLKSTVRQLAAGVAKPDSTPVQPVAPANPATPATATGTLGDPPKIASASNPAYQKKIDGLYASVKAGDTAALDAFIPIQQAKVDAAKLKPTQNAHDKWNAQLLTAAVELKAKATGAKIDAKVTDATATPAKPVVAPNPVKTAADTSGYSVKLLPETSGMNKLINAEMVKVQALVDSGDSLGLNSLLATAKHPETINAIADAKEYLTTGKVTPAAPTPANPAAAIGNAPVISAPNGIGSKTHPQYTKQADAVYQSALAGNKPYVDAMVAQYQAKVDAAKLKPNYPTFADGQYNKLLSYSQKVQAEMQTKATAGLPPAALKSAISKTQLTLAGMTLVGGKPGGSNPGGIYQDADGAKWLVKGSNQPDPDGGPAKNEVLAARLYNAAGGHAPEMRTVDLGTQYGGGIGVASKMQDSFQSLDVNNPAHVAKAREDFALDAWMANWDSVGLAMDNTVIDKDGNALRIDPGGALLYRAQGIPKGADFGKTVGEWNSLRDPSKNPQAAKVFAGMTDSELKASAAKVAAISDDNIQALVNRFGPGTDIAKIALAETLIARKQDVIAQAGLIGATVAPAKIATPAVGTAKPKFELSDNAAQSMSSFTANKIEALANRELNIAEMSDHVFNKVAEGLTSMDTAEINAWGKAVIGDSFKSLPGTATIDIPTKAEAISLLNSMKQAATPVAGSPPVKQAVLPTAGSPPVKPDISAFTAAQKASFDIVDNAVNKVGAYNSLDDQDVQDVLGILAKSTVSSPELKQYAQAWSDYLKAGGATTATKVTPTPTPTIKPSLPDFNSYKLESGNTNAPGINKKVDQIAALAQAGDVAGILALSYGSNTYAKKTVNLANDAMAALGSTATVTAGQKANTHPGIGTTGTTPPVKSAIPIMAQAQALTADINALAAKFAGNTVDGGIGALKTVLNDYGSSHPDMIEGMMNAAAAGHKFYSPEVQELAKKAMQVGIPNLISAWTGKDLPPKTAAAKTATPAPATHTGAWANQYGSGVGDLTTRVTALGAATAAKAHFDPAQLEPPKDYANLNGPGQGLSSQPAKNAVSNQIAQELYALAMTGDQAALKAYDIPAKVGGVKNTKTEEVVGAYRDVLIGQIENMLNPPKPAQTWKIGGSVTPENVSQTLQQAFPKYQQYQQVFQDKAQMVGRWGIQGGLDQKSFQKVVAAAQAIPEKKFTLSSPGLQELYDASHAQYNTLTSAEKSAIKSYTGGVYTVWNNQIATNQLSNPVKVGMRAYEKASVELPPGLILSRKWDPPNSLHKQITQGLQQLEGKVVQDVAMISSSIDPKTWGGEVRMRIRTLPGARGLYVDQTSKNAAGISANIGEREIVFNSKTRFLVTKVSTTNYDTNFFVPGGKIFMDVLALPEDPTGSVLDSIGGVK